MDQVAEAIALMIRQGEAAADQVKGIVKALTKNYPLV